MACGVWPGSGCKKAGVRVRLCCLSAACRWGSAALSPPHALISTGSTGSQAKWHCYSASRVLTGPYANVNEYSTPTVPSTPGLYETQNFFAFAADVSATMLTLALESVEIFELNYLIFAIFPLQ